MGGALEDLRNAIEQGCQDADEASYSTILELGSDLECAGEFEKSDIFTLEFYD